MKIHLNALACLFFSSLLFCPMVQAQQAGTHRTELQRHDIGIPGHEVIQVRVDLDEGVAFPAHKHPGEEAIYVLQGEIEYDVEGNTPKVLKAGDVLFVPAGVVHSAKNVGHGTASELGTYIVEKGKPLVTIV